MTLVEKEKSPIKSLARGFITGFIEAIICYPTEFVKTQLQLQSKLNPEYLGLLDCTKKTIRNHGMTALYRGATPLILGSSIKQSVRWAAYTNISGLFRNENGGIGILSNLFSGFCAGACEAFLAVTPIETIKTRATDDLRRKTARYTGSFDATIKIIHSEGLSGIYRGLTPTILKQGTNQLIRFPIQQFFMKLIFGNSIEKSSSPILNGLCGAMAGGTSVILTMPQDTIKTRMQGEEAKKLYKGFSDCVRQTVQKEGILFLWTGTWPRFVRVTLDVGITFTIYPFLKKII